jgi:hypothetical protein
MNGVLFEPDVNIDDSQLDANKDVEYLGQISDEEDNLREYESQQMPCGWCIHCGCIDNGGALCDRCKACTCMKAAKEIVEKTTE